MEAIIAARSALSPMVVPTLLAFFIFSLLGYIMECIVLTVDKKKLVINRGFVMHLPFCIIYGFGMIFGYAFLSPFSDNWVLLFLVGATFATSFEYAVAKLQIRLFGSFWWDYSGKPFNYKGILCLESSIGWGILGIILVEYLYTAVINFVSFIPMPIASVLAFALSALYSLDFIFSAYMSKNNKDVVKGFALIKLYKSRFSRK